MKKLRSGAILQKIKDKYEDLEKYLDDATKKLNKILQKAIKNGLKSLYLDELEFVHDALNNSMAQRQGRPSTPSRKSPEDLENIISVQEQRIISLMRRLDNYRQHSSEQEKRIMDYSQKVQRFGTSVGLLEMKVESLQYENKQLRALVLIITTPYLIISSCRACVFGISMITFKRSE
uniref:Uncharacterized protein n=1 Tax=Graphocephala atropunctata TaxID=36148 RepID=A0A1B6MT77_9HEMI